ncbi:MAG: hypothetical protein AAF685_05600 [Cyanobacteria bacterium P01_C01_bin.89]
MAIANCNGINFIVTGLALGVALNDLYQGLTLLYEGIHRWQIGWGLGAITILSLVTGDRWFEPWHC